MKDQIDARFPPTFQGDVEFRYHQAVHDHKTPAECEAMAVRIITALRTMQDMTDEHPSQSMSFKAVMHMILSARAWRIVANLRAEDFADAFLPDDNGSDAETILAETGSVL